MVFVFCNHPWNLTHEGEHPCAALTNHHKLLKFNWLLGLPSLTRQLWPQLITIFLNLTDMGIGHSKRWPQTLHIPWRNTCQHLHLYFSPYSHSQLSDILCGGRMPHRWWCGQTGCNESPEAVIPKTRTRFSHFSWKGSYEAMRFTIWVERHIGGTINSSWLI